MKQPQLRANITGAGSYLPEKILTNKDLEKLVDTNDKWIQSRTGIKERRFVAKGESTSTMATKAVKKLLKIQNINPDQIDEVIMGHSRQAGCGPNAPRIASVKAGIPDNVPAYGIQMACIAGMKSIMLAADSIRLGRSDIVLAGGMEHHSSVPYLAVNQRWGSKVGDVNLIDAMFSDGYKSR